MNIVKRDGSEVLFNEKKIIQAIKQANKTVEEKERIEEERIKKIADSIREEAEKSDKCLTVEEIQDKVERKLQEEKKYSLAKNYIKYRYERELSRQNNTVKEKLLATNVQNQNANVDENSFGGRTGEAISYIAKKYALENIVSKKTARLHNNNEIYIHDLDAYCVGSHNCLSIPFDKLLAEGFNTRQSDIRPAGSINTAFQLVAVIFQLQSLQQFGGVSATHTDITMVPYVRKSFYKHFLTGLQFEDATKEEKEKLKAEIKEAMQENEKSHK